MTKILKKGATNRSEIHRLCHNPPESNKDDNYVKSCLKHKFLVSKGTVVLRRWERSKQKFFGFIKRVDKSEITTVKDLES